MGHKKTCLKLTAKAPENKLLEKEVNYWKPSFLGAMLVLGSASSQCQVKNNVNESLSPSKLCDSTIISGMNSDKVGWLPVISRMKCLHLFGVK